MTPGNLDPKEQAFIEQALAASARMQRWNQIRVAVSSAVAMAAAIWFAFRPASPALGIEATILIVTGAMLTAVTAKLRAQIQDSTRVVLQALAALRPPSDSASARPVDR
jgi:hypothetical protein